MEPDEIEFIGEKHMIGIIPNFQSAPIHLISGDIGPFRPGLPVYVPLWLAVHLRKQQKCRIVPPHWMDMEILEEKKEEEKRERFFTKMPSEHYMVEAKLILSVAPEDIPRSEEIRTVIKDIYDIRLAKLRTTADNIVSGEQEYSRLDNLTMLETHSVRPILPHTMDTLDRLKSFKKIRAGGTQSATNHSSSLNTTTVGNNLSATIFHS